MIAVIRRCFDIAQAATLAGSVLLGLGYVVLLALDRPPEWAGDTFLVLGGALGGFTLLDGLIGLFEREVDLAGGDE